MNRSRAVLCFLCTWFAGHPASAADTEIEETLAARRAPAATEALLPTPSLERLEALLLERSPALAGRDELVLAAHRRVGPESALPDPMFEFMLQDVAFPDLTLGEAEMSMAAFELRQNLLFPGKRAARRQAALAAADVRSLERDRLRSGLLAELRVLYARLYALDHEAHTLGAARELLDLLRETAAMRYSAGETGQEEILKVQLELLRVLEREKDLATRRVGLMAGVNALLDLPAHTPLGEVVELPEAVLPGGERGDAAASRSPEVRVKAAALKTAEEEFRVARTDGRPNLSLGAGAAYREELDPLAIFRLGVEIPFWRKSKVNASIAAADHRVRAARHELRESRAAVRAELLRWRARGENAAAQVKLYEEAILPQTTLTVDAARASYITGQGGFGAVLEAFGLWLEARVRLAQRKADGFIAWAMFCDLAGNPGREGEGGTEKMP